MNLIDTNVIVAASRPSDPDNPHAKELYAEAIADNARITSHILEETVTYLVRKAGTSTACRTAFDLLHAHDLEVLIPTAEVLRKAAELVCKYDGLSMCDAVSVVLMHEKGIKRIYSFDADFDRFKDITRIH